MTIDNEGYWDILWLARDIQGNVALCRSLESEIPGFVKSSKERTVGITETLSLPAAIGRQRGNTFDLDKYTSLYGFYCFFADDPFETVYRLVGSPKAPRKFDELPVQARELMQENVLPFDIGKTASFKLKNNLFYDIMEDD